MIRSKHELCATMSNMCQRKLAISGVGMRLSGKPSTTGHVRIFDIDDIVLSVDTRPQTPSAAERKMELLSQAFTFAPAGRERLFLVVTRAFLPRLSVDVLEDLACESHF